MKTGTVVVWVIVAMIVTFSVTAHLLRQSAPGNSNGSTTESSNPVAVTPVTMVAMYQNGAVNFILNSDGKGAISGGCYDPGYSFNWKDQGDTIEISNWNWSWVDSGTASCEKKDGGAWLRIVWKKEGNRVFENVFKVKLK